MRRAQVLIRPAEERDVSSLAELMGKLGYPISLADMRDRLAFVASSPNDLLFVAETQNRVAGLIGVRIAEFIHWVARYGQITVMVVSSEYRRQGIGSLLLEHVEAMLKARGITDVHVHTGLHRQRDAHKFYLAKGYRKNGYRFTKSIG